MRRLSLCTTLGPDVSTSAHTRLLPHAMPNCGCISEALQWSPLTALGVFLFDCFVPAQI